MKLKGSLTVFLSLILVAVITLLFSMSELVRIYEIKNFSTSVSEEAIDSAFSEYNRYLWTNYRILGLDISYGDKAVDFSLLKNRIAEFAEVNSNPEGEQNFVRIKASAVDVTEYSFLTDNNGYPVIYQGIKDTKQTMVSSVIEKIKSEGESVAGAKNEDITGEVSNGKNSLADAKEELAQKKKEAREDDDPQTNPDDYEEPGEVEDNPLDAFESFKNLIDRGILSTVIADMSTVSDQSIELNNLPSHRSLNSGNISSKEDTAIIDKTIYSQYLLKNYSYFGRDIGHDGLSYEVEYIIAGKESDEANLVTIVEKILLMREAANYQTILNNGNMRAQAKGIAETLAGFTGNPLIIEAVELAIIGAWAYVESILDLRLLLKGGKVPLLKSESQWTSDVAHLSNFLDVNKTAKDCGKGISYVEYLRGFILLESVGSLGIRNCDVIENALNKTEDYRNVKLDDMVYKAKIDFNYKANTMFLNLLKSQIDIDGYRINRTCEISY